MNTTTEADDPGPAEGPGLQPERTSLAWRRTGLASTTASLVLVRLALLRDAPLIAALCAGLTIVALGAFLEGSVRHRGRRRWFEDDAATIGLSITARVSVLAVIGLAVAGVTLIATT